VCVCTIAVFAYRHLGIPQKVSFCVTLTEFKTAHLLVKSTVQSLDQPLYFDNWNVLSVTVK
jgi:hypothetical protein